MLIVRNVLIVVLVSLFHWNCRLRYPVMDVGSEYEDTTLEPGQCYYARYVDDDNFEPVNPSPFIIEFVAPKFEEIEVTYTLEELEQYKIYTGDYKIPRTPSHLDYIQRNDIDKALGALNVYGYLFCYIETPVEYWTVSKEKLLANELTVPMKQLVSKARLTKRYVKKQPKQLNYNQFYYKGGNWTEVRRVPMQSHHGHFQNKQIEERLQELGYPIIVNGVITEVDVEAIKDFRRKNNIKTDYLFDFETLKALGLQ